MDRLQIRRRRGPGLALLRQDRPAGEHGFGQRWARGRQVLGRDPGELFIGIADFIVADAAGGAARDDRGKQAGKAALRALGRRRRLFFLRLQRLDEGGDIRRSGFSGIEPQHVGDFQPDHFRFRQPPGAEFAAGHFAFRRRHHPYARIAQPGDVALRGAMMPHAHVHRRHGKHRLVGGEDQRGGEIIGDAGGHLGHQVRRGGADDYQIGRTAELDMADLRLVLQIPQRGVDLTAGKRGKAHRRDELRAAFRQHARDLRPALADETDKLARLVGGDAAADDQQDTRRNHAAVFNSHGYSPGFAR